jgi:hypothetical protein
MAVGIRANAQSSSQGSIAGTVFDSTGAVIPGATVTIHNNGTNAEIVLNADDSGYYKAPLLDPGTYTVTVKSANFTAYRATGVVVQISQTTNIEPKLSAGSEGTVVEVVASAPVINTEAPDFSSNLNQHAIQDIPINIRRWSALAMTTPGVVSDTSGFGLVSVRGQSTLLNDVLIDGADDNDAYWSEERGRTREAYSTSETAIREFAVNTGVYSSEFGRATGAVINSVTKSGTNQFHGQLYFYDRQSSWGAYNPSTLISVPTYTAGNPFPTGIKNNVNVKPEDLRKIYGGTVGGPIIKDKLWFIYTYDQHTRIFPFIGGPKSPATFFQAADTALNGSAACNLTGPNTATGYGAFTGTETATNGGFAGGQDAQACALAAREGLGTYAAGATAYNNGLLGLLGDQGQVPRAGYQEINTPKLDWQVNSKNHVSFMYHRLNWDDPGGVQTGTSGYYGLDSEGNDFVHVQYGLAKWSSQITPTVTNEVLYQYGRELLAETQQAFSAYESANFTSATGNVPYLPSVDTSTNGLSLGAPYYAFRLAYPDERKWEIGDTLYWSHGNHSFKFGGDVLHNWDKTNALSGAQTEGISITSSGNGGYYYPAIGNLLADINSKGVAGTCNSTGSASSTSLGSPSVVGTNGCYAGYVQAFGNAAYFITTLDWSAFVQDNWKFSPRLTLELGVRYDYEKLPAESAALVNPGIQDTPGHTPTANLPSDKNNFGPRVGFAYDVYGTGKTVLHGGYGLFYGRILNGTLLATRQSSGVTSGSQFTFAAGFTPTSTGAPTFPNNLTSATAPGVTPGAYYLDKNLQNPQASEYDLTLQQDLAHHNILSISYLGSSGQHEPNFINTNLNNATIGTATITVTGAGSPIPAGTYTIPQYVKPYANTAYTNITDVVSNVNSAYNAFVAEIQNRSYKMVQFDFNYTWSHTLDYAQNTSTGTATEGWQDAALNPRQNYGNSDFNVPNRFTGYVLFNVPNYARNGSPLGYIINGWSIDNNFQIQSGIPYSLTLTSEPTTQQAVSSGNIFGTGGPTWIPSILPGAGRNKWEQPRAIVDDAHLQKAFNFTDRYNLAIFANMFNVANHKNATSINTTGYAVTAGTNTGTLTYNGTGATAFGTVAAYDQEGFLYTQRLIEIGAKFNF